MSTSTEVRELTAGRELDALVAKKVMGWREVITGVYCISGAAGVPPENADGWWKTIPRYSTDIAAAWEVVEKLRGPNDDEFGGGEFWKFLDCSEAGWRAELFLDLGDGADAPALLAAGVGYALPEAICLAALKAVEA